MAKTAKKKVVRKKSVTKKSATKKSVTKAVMNNEQDRSIESWIWDAACSIRGAKDAPKYKDFILPLIFTKRLCDVFDVVLDTGAASRGSGNAGTSKEKPCASGSSIMT